MDFGRPTQKDAAYHEAGHGVATHFRPLAGKVTRLTIRKSDLPEGVVGQQQQGRIIPAVVGYAVDREQVRSICVVYLAGAQAEMRMRGDDLSGSGSDYRKLRELLEDAFFAAEDEAAIRAIPQDELTSRSPKDLYAEYAQPITDRYVAMLEELYAEARDLINEKWACVEAVAKALYRRKTLSGDRVREIIERVEQEG